MGRMLGRFDSDDSFDRSDLNKCPACGCFFTQDACPVCGLTCPEDFRAGNRKPIKQKRVRGGYESGRVTFVEWYHSWWFIILMLFVQPIVSLILLVTAPYKRSQKITAAAIAVGGYLTVSVGLWALSFFFFGFPDNAPVDTSLTREEYMEACTEISSEDFYRSPDTYYEEYVAITLTVSERLLDSSDYSLEYNTYYVCRDTDGAVFEILVRDCILDGTQNFIAGDVITVYGEGAGSCSIYTADGTSAHSAPCINAAYVTLNN